MLRLFHTCVLGLIGAGIVHLAILFMLPGYSVRDAWTQVSTVADYYEPVRLEGSNTLPAPEDPFLDAVACRFNLEDGMLSVRSQGDVPFWTMAIYDERGLNTFSISDRVSNGSFLDAVVLTPIQMQRLKADETAETDQALFLETNVIEGFVLVRAFVPDETWQPRVSAFLDSVQCEALESR